jgi:hypothetical protein
MFIRITNGVPETYTIGQLRRDNPNVSFPKDIPAETLEAFGVYPVKRTPQPEHNALTELVRLRDPVQINGGWVQHWETVELPVSQQTENLKAARGHAYTEEADPLFFKAQRGEAELAEWENKVQEIRDRYPYPTE